MKSRSLRLPAISAATDDWGNESWVVDCVCGVDFDDGEEMVDCDECGVWVHTRCSRYVKSEKLFACDKCKSKKLRKESEETEVAQLLVELPTKTLRMESPYPVSFASQNGLQVCSDIPMEEKVHVHGIPGGDTALFKGVSSVSSVFSPQLWKCTGYVPKKFNYQYREFPCWDIKQGDDDDDDDGDKIKETENRASNGADALFLLSKENGGTETRVDGSVALDMGPPTMKKDPKSIAKDDDSIKRIAQASDSGDAKQSASNEGKGVNVLKTDLHSNKHEGSSADVQILLKSDVRVGNSSSLENVSSDDTRVNPSKEATQMDENDRNQAPCPPTVEICNQTEDDMTSSLMHKSAETSTNKHDADDDINNNGRTYSRSNGTRSNKHNLEKVDPAPDGQIDATIETKVEINPPSDSTLDSSKNEDDSVPASIEVKKEAISVSQKVQNVDKTHSDSKVDEPPCGPTQPKGQMKGPESSIRGLSEGQPKSHKVTVVKSSTGKPSSKPSVPDRNLSGKQKVTAETNVKSKKDNNTSSEPLKNGDNNGEKPKRVAKDIPRSSHLSKPTTNASVSKKNSFDLKDSSGDSANSSRSESGAHEQNKSTSELSVKGEKTYQMNRQPAPKNHPPLSASTAATLSDEELALLLHQELNSSPRVPRVPRMRNAGSLPQLASSTPTTSTLMKRTSSSGGKDNVLVSRKRNKDLSNNGSSNSREFDGGKKVAYSRRHHEPVKNGSAKTGSSGPSSSNEANENAVQNGSDDETGGPTHRTLPGLPVTHIASNSGSLCSTNTVSSTKRMCTGLAPSTLATHSKLPQKVVTSSMPQRRSLQGLIADIMSKGKRMTYEELCNAVLPHWPNLRKHNGERYAYSSHSQAVLDCLRNRSEWSRLVDRGPKTNAGRKRRKPEADVANPESDDDYSTDRNTKGVDSSEFPKSKRKARKHRRLALQGRGIKEVRRRRKAEVVSDEIDSSDSSEESSYSDEGRTSGAHEASASSDEAGTMS